MAHFDLLVIGSGPAGYKAAIQAAKLGKHVCVIERESVVGGAAINTGTIPSKALREAILTLAERPVVMPRYDDFTAARNEVFGNLRGCCSQIIACEVNIIREHLARNGIDLREGHARFVDANTVEVELKDSRQNLTADRIVIAVGTTAAKPGGIPFDDCTVITSDEIFELDFLPHSMIVVGGGVIGTAALR